MGKCDSLVQSRSDCGCLNTVISEKLFQNILPQKSIEPVWAGFKQRVATVEIIRACKVCTPFKEITLCHPICSWRWEYMP